MLSTVRSEIERVSAICALVAPRAASVAVSRSRRVNGVSVTVPESAGVRAPSQSSASASERRAARVRLACSPSACRAVEALAQSSAATSEDPITTKASAAVSRATVSLVEWRCSAAMASTRLRQRVRQLVGPFSGPMLAQTEQVVQDEDFEAALASGSRESAAAQS